MKKISFKYSFLVVIIILLIVDILHLIDRTKTDYPYPKFDSIVVVLILLFNHLTIYYTKTSLAKKVMTTISWIVIIAGSIYIFWPDVCKLYCFLNP